MAKSEKCLLLVCWELLGTIGPFITKQGTHLGKPISVEEELAVILRCHAATETFKSLIFQFRLYTIIVLHYIEPLTMLLTIPQSI